MRFVFLPHILLVIIMIREPGDTVVHIPLPALDGSSFNFDSLKDRPFMLSFFRFASCPFCNLRMHELVTRFDELSKDFTIVAVFDSPLDNLQRHADKHQAPFPILADADNRYYQLFEDYALTLMQRSSRTGRRVEHLRDGLVYTMTDTVSGGFPST